MPLKVLVITDMNEVGSGYVSIALPTLMQLSEDGHDIKVIGLENKGREHWFPFSIIPAKNMTDAQGMIENFWSMWHFDVMLVLMDIPVQAGLLRSFQTKPFTYVGIFPVEADPLSYEWAMVLMQMDKQFVISDFGTKEVHAKSIMSAEHFPVGIDVDAWRKPTLDERESIRKSMGISEDTFVVLTVADNQERKNLPANFEAIKKLSNSHPNVKHILVTREKLYAGWNIGELADTIGITDKLMTYERGMPFKKLWMLYAASDAFLLLSKAEGLGLPIMEAMAVGLPIVGTDCTGIHDLLCDGRGFLVGNIHKHIDPFGNAWRYWADPEEAAYYLCVIYDAWQKKVSLPETLAAYDFTQQRTWEAATQGLKSYLRSIQDGKA